MFTGRQKYSATAIAIPVIVATSLVINSEAAALDLPQAESIAIQNDPATDSHRATARAMHSESIAADTLPDPKFRLGMFNVPLEDFDLEQNPTTQLRLGVQQHFPSGDVLELNAQKQQHMSRASSTRAEDSTAQLLLDLRKTYLRLFFKHESANIIANSKKLFRRLVKITEDQYASGRASQQDVMRAELELSRLDDRHTRTLSELDQLRAQLARWIGDSASEPIEDSFPRLPDHDAGTSEADIDELLTRHPKILALMAELEAARKTTDIARQDYSPGVNAFIEYRKRFGDNADGSEREDLMAAMVTMDIPLFTEHRQDRKVIASEERANAARYRLDDKLRSLKQIHDSNKALYTRARQRENLYRDSLLTAARNNTDAARKAYQSGVTEFSSLMRAQITELDVMLDALSVRIDKAIAQAHLLYIYGVQR